MTAAFQGVHQQGARCKWRQDLAQVLLQGRGHPTPGTLRPRRGGVRHPVLGEELSLPDARPSAPPQVNRRLPKTSKVLQDCSRPSGF